MQYLQDSFFIQNADNGKFFAFNGQRWELHYNDNDFSPNVEDAVQFKSKAAAEAYIKDTEYECFGSDGNTPAELKIVKLRVIDV